MEMEGSMNMMSWSRYHCLSWSFKRMRTARSHRAGRFHKIRRRRRRFRLRCVISGSAPDIAKS
jgi:hypothetical protein